MFDYPLSESELIKWDSGKKMKLRIGRPFVKKVDDYYVFENRDHIVGLRLQKLNNSRLKMKALSTVKSIFESDNSILMVGITGSLAMLSAGKNSDIDLMIVTKRGKLWTTRLKTLLSLKKKGISVRRAKEKNERDKLCLNVWIDENNLKIEEERQNPYTAHEIVQIIPLVNKQNTFEKLIFENSWTRDYWPNAVEPQNLKLLAENTRPGMRNLVSFEPFARGVQYFYMRRKITNEKIERGKAFFHPRDFSKIIAEELTKRGVAYE